MHFDDLSTPVKEVHVYKATKERVVQAGSREKSPEESG